jgi:hypothetical protein
MAALLIRPIFSRAAALSLLAAAAGCTDLDLFDCDPAVWTEYVDEVYSGEARPIAHLRREGGRLRIASELERDAASCADCSDRDGDGLADEWEAALLERVRPVVRFDRSEPLFCDPESFLGAVGRVVRGPEPGHFRAFVALFYTYDYGRCTVSRHRGDVERVVLDLIEAGPTELEVVAAYTAAHEYTPFDGGRVFQGGDLADLELRPDVRSNEPRWVVYASSGKHATYATPVLCAAHSGFACTGEDCADGEAHRELVFPIANAGEPSEPLSIDLFGILEVDPWTPEPFCPAWGIDRTPCGPGAIRDKLVRDPFRSGAPDLL